MSDVPETDEPAFRIDECEEAFVRDFLPYRGSPDPFVVWRAAWKSCRAAIEAAVREQPKPQQGDSAVASEGGSCVSVLAEQREANKTSLCVLCALLDAHEWHPNMRKDIEFAIAANRAAIERAALSTAGAQRRASEKDETTSAKEQR